MATCRSKLCSGRYLAINFTFISALLSISSALEVTPKVLGCLNVSENGVTSEHCFTAYNLNLTQPDAKASCALQGGRLAWITNEETQNYLRLGLSDELRRHHQYWIGLEMEQLPEWTWLNGKPYSGEL